MTTAADLEFTELQVAPVLAVRTPGQCAADPASISEAMGEAFGTLGGFIARHKLAINGAPRAIYHAYAANGVSFEVVLPVAGGPSTPADEPPIRVDTLPGTRAYRFTHHGPYPNLMQTYGRITAFLKEKGFLQADADLMRYMPIWEEYANDPGNTPPAELLTYIYLPVK